MGLNELMTSDFNDGYVPDELRNLLLEFRDRYRELSNINGQLERQLKEKDIKVDDLTEENKRIMKRNDILFKNISKYRNKLTWKERLLGSRKI